MAKFLVVLNRIDNGKVLDSLRFISESRDAKKHLQNSIIQKGVYYNRCIIHDSNGILVSISKYDYKTCSVERERIYLDGEVREECVEEIYQRTHGSKGIEVGKTYTYKTKLEYNAYKKYYNGHLFKVTEKINKKDINLDPICECYKGYFIDDPERPIIMVYSINLFK